ncbi:Adrenodoxin, mitochondrial [Nymphon striatum]|nr:Adrenodoxin, mitochondrial [Nymphon striatum]
MAGQQVICSVTLIIVYCSLVNVFVNCNMRSRYNSRDAFDEIMTKINSIDGSNCKVVQDLHLPNSSVSHIPVTKTLGTQPVFPNRTGLLQIHNMALSRGIFFSFILQKAHDDFEPGLLYHFMSVIADVGANRVVNASATYFSPNMSFTPSYSQFFNKTLPLFAPRAYRADDFNDPIRLQRISTLNTIVAEDLGAIPNNSRSSNYSDPMYKINNWFKSWLPDTAKRQDSKLTYNVEIAYGNGTNHTFVFHGPPDASDQHGPVKWYKPYFDCGRSNKWIMGGSVPITDRFARHTQFKHIEYPTYVAVSVVETDYTNTDINQCPLGAGNPAPNIFGGTAMCKNQTTQCEPINGFGLRRGGYQCRCKPGYRFPKTVRTPYLGEIIERAPVDDYEKSFKCLPIGYRMVLTQNPELISDDERYAQVEKELKAFGTRNWNFTSKINPNIVRQYIKRQITQETCHKYANTRPEMLELQGDIAHGKELQLENEARMALRLAHFISGFLQSRKPNARYAEFRQPDKPLTEDQMIGEVLSIVMGNFRIQGCGVFFDRNQFPNKTHFAPYAFRKERRNTRNFNVYDYSRKEKKNEYLTKDWFKILKTQWSTNTDDLEEYIAKINIRFNSSGEYSVKFDDYPIQYQAAELRHGYWTKPYFDCGGFHKQWVITYAAPFFGWDKIHYKLEFKGVVTTTMHLEDLDINQCPDDYWVNNAFKDTHRCDKRSTWCMPILGRGFETGGYKCECNQGYEYPFIDYTTYFDGEILEAEYDRLIVDQPSSVLVAMLVSQLLKTLRVVGSNLAAAIINLSFVFLRKTLNCDGFTSMRNNSKVNVVYILPDDRKVKAEGKEGDNLLDIAITNEVDLDGFGACEGTLACSTCHLIFKQEDFDKIPEEATDEELDMLDLAVQLTSTSRLGCQVCLTKELSGIEVTVPPLSADARGSP